MHIAQVIDTLKVGGAQTVVVLLAEKLVERGHAVTIVNLDRDEDTPVTRRLSSLPVSLHSEPGSGLLDVGRLRRLVDYLRHRRVDLLHAHLTYANIAGAWAGRLAGLPVVATIHSEVPDPGWSNRMRFSLEEWSLRLNNCPVVAVGNGIYAAQQRRFREGYFQVIPNAVQPPVKIPDDLRSRLRLEMAGSEEKTIFISVGRLAREKGHPDLLAAFSQVYGSCTDTALAIVGDGYYRSELMQQAVDLGIQDKVAFMGERSDAPQLLMAADIYVGASHWEGLPIAVLEAMSAGLPVVATRVGELPELVGQDAGFVVLPGQPGLLAEKMMALVQDPVLCQEFGRAGSERAKRDHSPEIWFQRWLEVYNRALKASRLSIPG